MCDASPREWRAEASRAEEVSRARKENKSAIFLLSRETKVLYSRAVSGVERYA